MDRKELLVQDTPINVAYPEAGDLHLRITLGACRFEAGPGEEDIWLAGACHDPTGRRPPEVIQEGGNVRITEGEPNWREVPGFLGGLPRYDLKFGSKRPFALTVETGASEFDLDLGGVPVRALTVKQGAGSFELDFSTPNPEPMTLLEVGSGAAGVELKNLANANFAKMRLTGGAAGYELDFGGTLRRDAEVEIETGLSGVEISVPATTAARIVADTVLGGLDVGDGFTRQEGAFLTGAALAGDGPLLTIRAGVKVGSLRLRAA